MLKQNQTEQDDHGVPSVVVIGPGRTAVGGMASVMGQMLSLARACGYRFRGFPITTRNDEGESLPARLHRHLRHLSLLREQLRRYSAKAVHIHTCSGFSFYRAVADMWAARREGGCRVVLHIHGAAFDEFHARGGWIRRAFIASALARADRVVALSEGWRRKLRDMSPGARVVVIENAIALPPPVSRCDHGGPCRILQLSRMDQWKGVDDLLEACASVTARGLSIELVLAGPPGTAGDKGVLLEKIHTHKLDGIARYVGNLQGEEKSRRLIWADLFVQPSHHEGLPLSILEAFAYGLPVIATRVGAVPEVVEHQRQGLLVPARRPAALADAIAELVRDQERRREMSEQSRELAKDRFSLSRFEADLCHLYDELVGATVSGNHRSAASGVLPSFQDAPSNQDQPHEAIGSPLSY